jgi:DNA-binding MarR family transcriptional regulator
MKLRFKNIRIIVDSINDKQWHQYNEILQKTRLSRPILANHLKEMRQKHLIEKKEGDQDYRKVYYKATPTLNAILEQTKQAEYIENKIIKDFSETKELSFALLEIAFANVGSMLWAFKNFKIRNIDIADPEAVRFFLELFVFDFYEAFMLRLTKLGINFIDEIDVEQASNILLQTINDMKKVI